MTAVDIASGICGFSTTVRVEKGKQKKVLLTFESECEKIQSLGDALKELDMISVLKSPINENPIYVEAGQCQLHTSCPVPCGIIKAVEVKLGLALKKNVSIGFLEDE